MSETPQPTRPGAALKLRKDMEKGKVVWFDSGKGFGFIEGEDGADVFVHYSAIQSQSKRKNLQPDQRVEFERRSGPKGPFAATVRVVTE